MIPSQTFKKLLSNFMSLSSLQIASYIFPLLTIPYLVRVLGIENFGQLNFAMAIIFYFQILTQYGFQLTGTKEIALHRDDPIQLEKIFSTIMFVKFTLLFLSFMILAVLMISVERFRDDYLLYLFAFGSVIGEVLFPTWFFQGIEKMKYIAFINVASKIITTLMIFILIKTSEDYLYVPLLYAISSILAGSYSLYFISKHLRISIHSVGLNEIYAMFSKGKHLFISHLGTNLYTSSLTVILGFMTNNTIVGYYTAAEKITKAITALAQPIYQTVYPHIMVLMKSSEKNAVRFIVKIAIYSTLINLIIFSLLTGFSHQIIELLYAKNTEMIAPILQILSFLVIILGLSNILCVQTMIAYNFQKAFSKILVFIGVISLPFSFAAAHLYGAIGIAFTSVGVELVIIITILSYLKSQHVFIFNKGLK